MRKLIHTIPVGVPSALIIILDAYLSLASKPVPTTVHLFEGADKVVHFLLYLVVTLIFIYDYSKFKYPHHTKLNIELVLMAVSMLLGLIMESLQLSLTVDRSFEFLDIVANVSGAAVGFLIQRLWLMHEFRKIHASGKHHHHHHHHHHHSEK